MPELIEVASGLAFPEGPIAMPDGTRRARRDVRAPPDARPPRRHRRRRSPRSPAGPTAPPSAPAACSTSATTAAASPRRDMDGLTFPGRVHQGQLHRRAHPDRRPGHAARSPTSTRSATADRCWAPNDLVFDAHGGFYFTDHGLVDDEERVAPPLRHLLRQGRRLGDQGGRLPGRRPQRHRPVARRHEAVLGRDVARAASCSATIVAPGELVRAVGLVDTSQCLYGFPGLPAPRLAGRRRRRQRVRRDDRQRRRVGRLARRRARRLRRRPATSSRPTSASAATT